MRLYEGMFIVTNQLATEGWEKVEEVIREVITRQGGEVVRMRKWGERVFTCPIKKQPGGVYVLVHFKMDPQNISKMELRLQIAPTILRALFLVMDERVADESYAKEAGDEGMLTRQDDEDDDEDRFRRRRRDDDGFGDRDGDRRRGRDGDIAGVAIPRPAGGDADRTDDDRPPRHRREE
ncbi:MAG: 30S ribosomal protein S6 [Planctomycetota bacterium]